MEYARRAGEQAGALLAFEEAARHFQLALQALGSAPAPNAGQRCKLLIALGEAQTQAGEDADALEAFRAAATIARALGLDELVRAALGFEGASWRPALPGDRAARLLDEALSTLGEHDSPIRAHVLGAQARALGFTTDFERAERVVAQAVAMARRLGDDATLSLALNTSLCAWQPWRPDLVERASLAKDAYQLARRVGDKVRMAEAATTHLLYAIHHEWTADRGGRSAGPRRRRAGGRELRGRSLRALPPIVPRRRAGLRVHRRRRAARVRGTGPRGARHRDG